MSTQQLNDELGYAKRAAQLLSHPTVKRLARLHPDADWAVSAWNNTVCGNVALSVRNGEPWDISGLDGVHAGNYGYFLQTDVVRKRITLRGGDAATVVIRINVEQSFSEEEKELLRAVGKLVRITEPSSYETLVCQ